jgi:hypothetical protein
MPDPRPLSIPVRLGTPRKGRTSDHAVPCVRGEVRKTGRHRSASAALLILALAVAGTPAFGQEPFNSFPAARWRPAAFALRFNSRAGETRRDYRWVGTAVVGAGLGITAGLVARAACGNSEHGPRDCTGVTIGVGLLGAAVGGVLGNLLGRAIHRR